MEGHFELPAHLLRALVRRVLPIVRQDASVRRFYLLPVPLRRIPAGHEDVVVLAELSERHEDLAVVDDLRHLVPDADVLFLGAAVYQVAVVQEDRGALDRTDRGDDACFPGALDLELRPYRHELVHGVHARRVVGEGGETGRAGAAVTQPEASETAGMAEDGPSRDHIFEILVGGLDDLLLGFGVGVDRLVHVEVLSDEVPAFDPELVDVLLQLGCLQAHAFGDDQAGSSPDAVSGYARQVPETGNLHAFGPFAVDHDRAFADDGPDLLRSGGELEMLALFVQRDLLIEPGYLSLGGDVLPDAERLPHDVADEHRHGLPGTSGRPDRSGEDQVGEGGPVGVMADLGGRDPLQGSDQYALGDDGEAEPHGPVEGLVEALARAFGVFLRHLDGDDLPVPVFLGLLADKVRDAFHVIVG